MNDSLKIFHHTGTDVKQVKYEFTACRNTDTCQL